jgi:hypothetical protein
MLKGFNHLRSLIATPRRVVSLDLIPRTGYNSATCGGQDLPPKLP